MLRVFNPELSALRPKQLLKESLQYVPAVYARQIFPQEEQDIVGKYWMTPEYGHPRYHINRWGYRGRDFDVIKTPGTIRVIVYGGSAVFDLALPQGKDWPCRIEKFLHKDGFTNVEVINAGIPANTAADSLGSLFAEGHLFQPDYVILYNTWNDIKLFASDKPLLREVKPYVPDDNPFLYYKNRPDRFCGEHSLLYNFLRYVYFNVKYKPGLEGAARIKKKDYAINPNALAQFKMNVEMFVDCARDAGAVPILMTQGSLIRQDNQEQDSFRLRYVEQIVPYDFSYKATQAADDIIRTVAKDKKAEMIDAKKLMVEKDQMLFFDHVHLDGPGSEQLAAIVGGKLKELIGDSNR